MVSLWLCIFAVYDSFVFFFCHLTSEDIHSTATFFFGLGYQIPLQKGQGDFPSFVGVCLCKWTGHATLAACIPRVLQRYCIYFFLVPVFACNVFEFIPSDIASNTAIVVIIGIRQS